MKTRFGIGVWLITLLVCLVLLVAQGGAQSAQEKVPGPWANAKVGDYLEAQGLYEDVLGDRVVDVENTVTAADDQTVTVKTVRKFGDKAPREFSNKLPRYVSKADYDKQMAQYGEKIRTLKFSLDGKEIDAEEYTKKDTDPKDRDTYAITTTIISKEVPSWVLRVGRNTYIKGQPRPPKLLLDVKRFLRKG